MIVIGFADEIEDLERGRMTIVHSTQVLSHIPGL